jgi:hypothetical protein
VRALLHAGYALFAVAAGGRCVVQWLDAPSAPATWLTTLAFTTYVVGLILVRHGLDTARGRRLVRVVAGAELVGVLGVGTLGLVRADLVGEATVWSQFGAGYAFAPVVIPLLMLVAARFDGSAPPPSAVPAPRKSARRPIAHSGT